MSTLWLPKWWQLPSTNTVGAITTMDITKCCPLCSQNSSGNGCTSQNNNDNDNDYTNQTNNENVSIS
jgi:hypothetical protein